MWAYAPILLLVIAGLAAYLNRRSARRHVPLSARQPERRKREVPLGMEAIDLDALSSANRRNESLERGQTNWLSNLGVFGRSDAEIAPLADDETYAARYHAAFHKKQTKD